METINRPTQTIKCKRDLYYTDDHEWLDFQGSWAYFGVCKFKLTGFYVVDKVLIKATAGIYKKGEEIANLSYNDYTITLNMPVDGSIKTINEALVSGDKNVIVEQPESTGWVAIIIPSSPLSRQGLLNSEQYRIKQYLRQFG
jgi:glycine cleavage system H protein